MWEFFTLRQERDVLRKQCSNLEAELQAERARFAAEVDRNREREDTLVGNICQMARADRPFRHKSVAKSPDDPIDVVFDDDRPTPEETEVQNDAIHKRAQDFYRQAQEKGITYDYEVLVETIRQNPEMYLDN